MRRRCSHALRRRYGRSHTRDAELEAEMSAILAKHGYNPHDARMLVVEGMGAHELEHRIRSTSPGGMGSLEYTHNLQKLRSRR
jgi:hypothetical protein